LEVVGMAYIPYYSTTSFLVSDSPTRYSGSSMTPSSIGFWAGGALAFGLIAYLFVGLYVVAPLIIRAKKRIELEPEYITTDTSLLPSRVSAAFDHAASAISSNGFCHIGTVKHFVVNTGQDSYVSAWVNRDYSDSVQIIGVCTPSPLRGLTVVTLTAFRTDFADGTSIVTSNSGSASVFPADPRESPVRCPNARNISMLYQFHRARVAKEGKYRSPTLKRMRDISERLRNEHHDTYRRLVEDGYHVLSVDKKSYAYTYKGAFTMTYRLLPPLRQMRKWKRDRTADKALRELGFGSLAEFCRM
jgi:hypothetical protein